MFRKVGASAWASTGKLWAAVFAVAVALSLLAGFAGVVGAEQRGAEEELTASGEVYDPDGYTAASPDLAFGTKLVLTYKGSSVVVEVNDRGPFDGAVELDLTRAAADAIGLTAAGTAVVDVVVADPNAPVGPLSEADGSEVTGDQVAISNGTNVVSGDGEAGQVNESSEVNTGSRSVEIGAGPGTNRAAAGVAESVEMVATSTGRAYGAADQQYANGQYQYDEQNAPQEDGAGPDRYVSADTSVSEAVVSGDDGVDDGSAPVEEEPAVLEAGYEEEIAFAGSPEEEPSAEAVEDADEVPEAPSVDEGKKSRRDTLGITELPNTGGPLPVILIPGLILLVCGGLLLRGSER